MYHSATHTMIENLNIMKYTVNITPLLLMIELEVPIDDPTFNFYFTE